MTARFLADEDLDSDIVKGLRQREPAIDILDVKTSDVRGTKDPVLLSLAAEQDRIAITHDRRTMTRYFGEYLAAGKASPGIFSCGLHRKHTNGAIGSCIYPSDE